MAGSRRNHTVFNIQAHIYLNSCLLCKWQCCSVWHAKACFTTS